jgi:hypothetical protein
LHDHFTIRPATVDDAIDLSGRLRGADLLELSGSPRLALERGVTEGRECHAAVAGGRLLALFGVGNGALSDVGCPWLLSSPELTKQHRKQLLRECKAWLVLWFERYQYRLLMNKIHKKNAVHIRWLKWMGAEVIELPSGDFDLFTITPGDLHV